MLSPRQTTRLRGFFSSTWEDEEEEKIHHVHTAYEDESVMLSTRQA